MSLTACCLPGTLRYHLARIQELFGIDVETPERRFATEPAIHVQRVIDS